MSLARVHNFSISLDGFGTGEGLSRDAPFGPRDVWPPLEQSGRHSRWNFRKT